MTLPPGKYSVAVVFRMQNNGTENMLVEATVEPGRAYLKTGGGVEIPIPHEYFEKSQKADGSEYFVSREVLMPDATLEKLRKLR